MPQFTLRSEFDVPVEELFAWHERPGAFERLTPPWDAVRVVEQRGGIRDGARVVLDVPLAGPLATRWVVEHEGYVADRQFRDVQREGPFARWEHTHRFEPLAGARSALEDQIDYALPLGLLGRLGGGALARAKIRRAFAYRHAITRADLERHAMYADRPPMHVAITGATGLIGSALAAFLTTGGHRVSRVVRGDRAGPADIRWDPARGEIDAARLEGVDAVVHLAGEPVSERWTAEHKRDIYDSRVLGTGLVARTIASLDRPPRVLVSASAVGIYGDGGDRLLDETGPHGRDFLVGVAEAWEAAADPARSAGVRVVHPRFGVVLSPAGGALKALLPPFQMGGGGKIGNGRQWMSWIALDDAIGALHHLLLTDALHGPVNVTAPNPVTNGEFSRTLAHVLGRPAVLTVPGFALKAMLGEMADVMLLRGQRVVPRRLVESGFSFRYPSLEEALRFELGRM